jgi:transposase-like protein
LIHLKNSSIRHLDREICGTLATLPVPFSAECLAHVPRLDLCAEVRQGHPQRLQVPHPPVRGTVAQGNRHHYSKTAPKLTLCMQEKLPQGLSVFALPTAHQERMLTSNARERVNQEIKRRTSVVRLLPNEDVLLRLSAATLPTETSEDWESEKIHITM